MPKSRYYSDIKIIKKPLKQRVKGILKFFIFFVLCGCCFFSAKIFSGALTVGKIGDFVMFGDTNLKVDSNKLFAVSLGEYDTKSEAEKVALGSNVQGAGGFVWEDKKYYVIGNIYLNIDDANKVVKNLKESNYKVSVKEISFPKLKIDFSMYENKDMDTIKKSINVFDKAYKMLYENSISFDKGEISHLAVSSNISQFRGEVKSIIVSVQNLINKSSSKLKNIQSSLIMLDELLDQTIIKTIDNTSTNYSLKHSISHVVRIKYDLFNTL